MTQRERFEAVGDDQALVDPADSPWGLQGDKAGKFS
jgi:hypothetical protein